MPDTEALQKAQEYQPEPATLIDDMLAWQEMIDNAPASINMRGAHRFWRTVAHHLGRNVFADGSPDINEVTIPLTDKVGLQLTAKLLTLYDPDDPTNTHTVDMEYRFVTLEGKEWYTP